MKRLQLRALVLGAALLVVAGAWYCGRARRPLVPTADAVLSEAMAHLDTDRDGTVSRTEWEACGGRKEVFDAFDFHGNGKLDAREFEIMFFALDPRPGL